LGCWSAAVDAATALFGFAPPCQLPGTQPSSQIAQQQQRGPRQQRHRYRRSSRHGGAGQRQVPGFDDINAAWPTLPISRVPAARLSDIDLAGLLKLLLV